jgi:hypothetical protein
MEKSVEESGCIRGCAQETTVVDPPRIILFTRPTMHTVEIRRGHRESHRSQFQRVGYELLESSSEVHPRSLFDCISDEKIADIAIGPTGTRFKV